MLFLKRCSFCLGLCGGPVFFHASLLEQVRFLGGLTMAKPSFRPKKSASPLPRRCSFIFVVDYGVTLELGHIFLKKWKRSSRGVCGWEALQHGEWEIRAPWDQQVGFVLGRSLGAQVLRSS